jgi:hypothetical protein
MMTKRDPVPATREAARCSLVPKEAAVQKGEETEKNGSNESRGRVLGKRRRPRGRNSRYRRMWLCCGRLQLLMEQG